MRGWGGANVMKIHMCRHGGAPTYVLPSLQMAYTDPVAKVNTDKYLKYLRRKKENGNDGTCWEMKQFSIADLLKNMHDFIMFNCSHCSFRQQEIKVIIII
jgi:hypothetical protein